MPRKLDLKGQRFGRLVALEEGPKHNNRTTWRCLCDCGNEKIALTSQLTRGATQSCGCLQKEKTRLANQSADLSGKKFGRLTVIERLPNSSKWKCQCECGNIIITTTNHLNTGHTQSCGCLQRDKTHQTLFKNLTGNRYGMLFVEQLDIERSTPKDKYYICKCDCGNVKSIHQSNLMSGIVSCGCLRMSRGEYKINQILTEYNIPFIQEYAFDACINPKTNKKLRFDFYVDNKYLIEFNGKQHYEQDAGWDEALEDIQYRDNIKAKWAQEHNIPLIIIPYDKYDDLTIDDLLPFQANNAVSLD